MRQLTSAPTRTEMRLVADMKCYFANPRQSGYVMINCDAAWNPHSLAGWIVSVERHLARLWNLHPLFIHPTESQKGIDRSETGCQFSLRAVTLPSLTV